MMNPYPAYKESGLPWLGPIPEHWEIFPLKHFLEINRDTLSENTPSDYAIEYLDIGNVGSTGVIGPTQRLEFKDAPSRARRIVKSGDTVISTVRTYLKAIAHFDDCSDSLVASTGFAVLTPRKDVLPRYVSYLVHGYAFINQVTAESKGVNYPAITSVELGNIKITVTPNLLEQTAIVAFLDRKTADIERFITKKRQLIALLNEQKAAIINQAVTKGLNPDAPMKPSGVEWLGDVPAHWKVAPLYARYHVQLGKMLDSQRITGTNLAPYLRNVDVQWKYINVDNLPQMDFDKDDRIRFSLRTNDVLVCEGGEVGRAAVWQGELSECFYQKALHRLRPFKSTDVPMYLCKVLFAAANRDLFVSNSSKSTIDHLPAEKFRRYRFPFPPYSEQAAIVGFIEAEESKIENVIARTEREIELINEYRTTLISDAVTGKIDVREAATA